MFGRPLNPGGGPVRGPCGGACMGGGAPGGGVSFWARRLLKVNVTVPTRMMATARSMFFFILFCNLNNRKGGRILEPHRDVKPEPERAAYSCFAAFNSK